MNIDPEMLSWNIVSRQKGKTKAVYLCKWR